jgi:hypothetical protein
VVDFDISKFLPPQNDIFPLIKSFICRSQQTQSKPTTIHSYLR